uniref:Uncharacterized protein n=1 Tax=Babesia bovis TaxID=5865 RepID=A7AMU2_BABBO|eukprot:XP_001611444.1 hypothetical protein [Babesia bovis T2Bo]
MHKRVDLVLFRDNRAIVVCDNVVGIRAIPLPSEDELPPVGPTSTFYREPLKNGADKQMEKMSRILMEIQTWIL